MSYMYCRGNHEDSNLLKMIDYGKIEINHAFSEQDYKNFLRLGELSNNKEINIIFNYQASSMHDEHKTNIDDLKNLKKLSVLMPNLNITVCEWTQKYSLEEAFMAEQTVFDIAKNLNDDKNLSKLKKFLFAYDYVISKTYKSDGNKHDKNFLGVMTTDNIVCGGYAKLLTKLCSYLDIECEEIMGEDATDREHYLKDRHALCYVKFKDEKYNIDGAFLSDPTWDSIKDGKKSYNYALFPIQSVLDKNSAHSAYFCKGYNGKVETHGEYCGCILPENSSPIIEKDCIEKVLKDIGLISSDDDKLGNATQQTKNKEEFII